MGHAAKTPVLEKQFTKPTLRTCFSPSPPCVHLRVYDQLGRGDHDFFNHYNYPYLHLISTGYCTCTFNYLHLYLEITATCTFSFLFFFPSHLLSSPFFSLSLLVVTQIRGHIAGSSPPLPTTVRALHFYREKISALSSLVDSRRIVLTHARRSQQLIFFVVVANEFKISPRRDSNHGSTLAAFEGYH